MIDNNIDKKFNDKEYEILPQKTIENAKKFLEACYNYKFINLITDEDCICPTCYGTIIIKFNNKISQNLTVCVEINQEEYAFYNYDTDGKIMKHFSSSEIKIDNQSNFILSNELIKQLNNLKTNK